MAEGPHGSLGPGDGSRHAGSPRATPASAQGPGHRQPQGPASPTGPVQAQMAGVISGKKYPRGPSWVCSFFCSSAALTKLPLLSLVH